MEQRHLVWCHGPAEDLQLVHHAAERARREIRGSLEPDP